LQAANINSLILSRGVPVNRFYASYNATPHFCGVDTYISSWSTGTFKYNNNRQLNRVGGRRIKRNKKRMTRKTRNVKKYTRKTRNVKK